MSVKINLDGDGFKYENKNVSLQQAAQIVAFLNPSDQHQVLDVASRSAQISSPVMNQGTIRQAIDDAGAKTTTQKIAVIAKYLQDKGQSEFTRSELMDNLRRAGERLPKNIGRDIKDAIKADYICESENQRGDFYLTNSGITAITEGFASGTQITKTKKTSKKGSSGKKTTKPDNEKLLDIRYQPNWSNNPHFHNDLKTKSDRILWVLGYCESQGIEEMTAIDVSFVMWKMGSTLPSTEMTANTQTHKRAGRLYKDGNKYNIEQSGKDYLKSLVA